MNFFEQQERSRRRSRKAMVAFAVTVLLTVLSVSLLGGVTGQLLSESGSSDSFIQGALIAAAVSFLAILLSWGVRAMSLANGPEPVMKEMGAARVTPDAEGSLAERRLWNVVEEMAIASGMPVPDVFLIDSDAINACAVGMEVDKAAVGVTRGALEKLNRDELQGVVAHEFSHILHGDMALNTHMIAWLAGLFTISEIGRMLFTVGAYSGHGRIRTRSRGRNDESWRLLFLGFGGGVWLMGSVGVFFGRLLQASVSRQREFLADASAVQYTRNPDGIGNALRKLGPRSLRGRMVRPHNDCEHMMFANLRSRQFAGWFASHPPLADRISSILPTWDGSYLSPAEKESASPPPPPPPPPRPAAGKPAPAQGIQKAAAFALLLQKQNMPDADRLARVAAWRESLNPELVDCAHDPARAGVVVMALTVKNNKGPEWEAAKSELNEDELELMGRLFEEEWIAEGDGLNLLDLCIPAIRAMPEAERERLVKRVDLFCAASNSINLFEYSVRRILRQQTETPDRKPSYLKNRVPIQKLNHEITIMFSVLSWLGADNREEAEQYFKQAADYLIGFVSGMDLQLLPFEQCRLEELDRACKQLPKLAPGIQERLILAGLAAITASGTIRPEEQQAFRAFAAALRIPVPPGL